MEPDFEHIKRSLTERSSSLPPELDWEQMEEGILQKMDALEAEEQKKKRPFGWLFGGRGALALTLLLLGIVAMLALYPGSPFRASSQAEGEVSLNQQPPTVSPEQTSTADESRREAFTGKGKAEPAAKETPGTLRPDEAGPMGTEEASARGEGLTTAGQAIAPPLAERPLAAAPTRPAATQPIAPTASGAGRSEEQASEGSAIEGLARLSHRGAFYLPLSAVPLAADCLASPAVLSETMAPAPRPRGRLTAAVGSNLWSPGFGREQPERAAYETSLLSYQARLSYLRPLGRQWTLMVGVQYQRLESRFERTFDIEGFEVLLTDVVLERENNLITGKVRERRGDITVTVPATRSITHFNATELYQAQLALGRTWTHGRLQADALVGASINLLTHNQGRTLYQGEVKSYAGAATDFLANQGKLNGLISGRLTYRLSERWGLVAGLQLQQSLLNWSLEPGTPMHPTVMGMELGLSYRL